jgi:hypothetical protein
MPKAKHAAAKPPSPSDQLELRPGQYIKLAKFNFANTLTITTVAVSSKS